MALRAQPESMSVLELTTEGAVLTTDAASQPLVVLGLDAASTVDLDGRVGRPEAIARGAALQIVTCSGASCSAANCSARRGPALIGGRGGDTQTPSAAEDRGDGRSPLHAERTRRHGRERRPADRWRTVFGHQHAPAARLDRRARRSRRTSCPVIALRGQQRQPIRRIAVGIDDSNAAAIALDWAADEAYRHGAEVDHRSRMATSLARPCAASTGIEPRRNAFSTTLSITARFESDGP